MKLLLVTLLCMLCPAVVAAKDIDVPPAQQRPSPEVQAAVSIAEIFVDRYRDDDGATNFADVFNALGALAGFGCQMAIREGFIKSGAITEQKAFIIVQTKDGGRYYFGDFLNAPLLGNGSAISVWSLIAEGAQRAGATALPDIREIADNDAKTVGTRDFGIPRVPERYRSAELPIDIVKKNWPAMQARLQREEIDPRFWGWTFALAAQHLMVDNRDRVDPAMAAKIVMEAAIPMSKIDPATIGIGRN
jgi:hypothetical protein